MADLDIRWLIRRDLMEVLDIENAPFAQCWTEEDFLCCLRQRNCIGMVVERQERIVGFMIYELLKHQLHVLNFAVHPDCRRQGIGSQMVEKLKNKLIMQRRNEIFLEVRETNPLALFFFRNVGLRAIKVLRGYYEDTDEDAIRMAYRLRNEPERVNRWECVPVQEPGQGDA